MKVKLHYGNSSQHPHPVPTPSSGDTARSPRVLESRPGLVESGEHVSTREHPGAGTHRAHATSLSTALPRGSKQNSRTAGSSDQHCEAAWDTLSPIPSKGRTWCSMREGQGGAPGAHLGVWPGRAAVQGGPGSSQDDWPAAEAPPLPLSLLTAAGCTVSLMT